MTASFFLTLRAYFSHCRIDLVFDNAPWHYGADVAFIAKTYHISLHYLPVYSPDLNPIKPLWDWIRQGATYNYGYDSFTLKKQKVHRVIETICMQPEKMVKRLVVKFHI